MYDLLTMFWKYNLSCLLLRLFVGCLYNSHLATLFRPKALRKALKLGIYFPFPSLYFILVSWYYIYNLHITVSVDTSNTKGEITLPVAIALLWNIGRKYVCFTDNFSEYEYTSCTWFKVCRNTCDTAEYQCIASHILSSHVE